MAGNKVLGAPLIDNDLPIGVSTGLDGRGKLHVKPLEDQFKILIDDSTADTYIGYATPSSLSSDPVWQILKLVPTTGLVQLLYAGGNGQYINVWDNRTSLVYS